MFSWTDVDSSLVVKVGYADEGKILRIVFHSGSIYDYEGVPLNVYNHMISSISVGRYYNNFIKGKYKSSEIFDMNCFPFCEKDKRDFVEIEGIDDDFFNALRKPKEDNGNEKFIVIFENGISKLIFKDDIFRIMDEAHKNKNKIIIAKVGITIVDWTE